MISATLFVIPLVMQSIRLTRLPRIDDDDWANSVAAAANLLGLQRPIVSLQSDTMTVPTVVGVVNPRLVIPSDWRTWSQTQRQCILLHELAHITRRDVLTQLIGRIALLAYWFNPLVWHAVRQMRAQREFACDDSVLLAGQKASDYAEELLRTLKRYRPIRSGIGVAMAHSARLDRRVLAMLDPERRRDPVGPRFAIILPCVVGLLGGLLGGVTLATPPATANPSPKSTDGAPGENPSPAWKELRTIEYPGRLPVSVVFSADGKTLLTGDTDGGITALSVAGEELHLRWKSNVGGSHAAVAFSTDSAKVYATTEHGARILDAAQGKEKVRIDAKDSNPTAIGVFPNQTLKNLTASKIVFGNPRGYFVKLWLDGALAPTFSTIKTTTMANGAEPVDEAAVPLAVDPGGRSAIMTGPIDATGKVSGVKGKNVLWAYVCGNYDKGRPGNRVMIGHSATVVSAAWSKEGGTAVTGDSAGRVIVWDANTMKETRRVELGGRVAALAISNDGTRIAAYVVRERGEVYVWESANPINPLAPIHTDLGDFRGSTTFASLSFAPDATELAGCAIDKRWLNNLGELIGEVHVWELSAQPKAQLTPERLDVKPSPKGSSMRFVVPR
jgi:WD40 repeat protein